MAFSYMQCILSKELTLLPRYIGKKTCLIFVQLCDVTVCLNSLLHVSTCMILYAPFEQDQQ